MKILIISDSHGKDNNIEHVINKVGPIDLLIHLGDFNSNLDYIKNLADCPVEAVCGNNDFFCDIKNKKVMDIEGYKILLTHGHRYGVSYNNLDRIENIGKQYGADIIMFGHTHRPIIHRSEDVWFINPGSISLPRQDDHRPTYIIMEIDQSNKVHFTLNHIKKAFKFKC